MTPDTSNYMIAGFIVIFTGVIGYAISLGIRKNRLFKKISDLEETD